MTMDVVFRRNRNTFLETYSGVKTRCSMSLKSAFFVLLVFLKLNGINCVPKQNRKEKKFCTNLIWNVVAGANHISAALYLYLKLITFLFDSNVQNVSGLVHAALYFLYRICIFKRKGIIFETIEKLEVNSDAFLKLKTIVKIRDYNVTFCIVQVACIIFLTYINFESYRFNRVCDWLKQMRVQSVSTEECPTWLMDVVYAIDICGYYSFHMVFGFFSIIYSGFCFSLQQFLKNLQARLKKAIKEDDIARVFQSYDEVLQVIEFIEDAYCVPVFISTIICMVALFRAGYYYSFRKSSSFSFYALCLAYSAYNLCVFLILITVASKVNRIATQNRSLVKSLERRYITGKKSEFLEQYLNINRKVLFSLGNTYIINQSLIWTAIGTVFSYGIIIGTLGSVNSWT
ncbi:hypothetical protein NPIL_415091 [Nephila pilipes]|uniref:Gustatory receptor n=1 Tax=Nephila pilipes TaxID=299642 RepID=A0A8X6IF52_NEPPI|nr:hypothetical protein NPIL_415091 [Nephila pilipes]